MKYFYFLCLTFIFNFSQNLSAENTHSQIYVESFQDKLIQSSASLLSIIDEQINAIDLPTESEINFTNEDISNLWNNIFAALPLSTINCEVDLGKAYTSHQNGMQALSAHSFEEAKRNLKRSQSLLSNLWINFIEEEQSFDINGPNLEYCSNSIEETFLKNAHSPSNKKIHKHLMQNNHPLKPALDAIFFATRASLTINTFTDAGFMIIKGRLPMRYITVARHPNLKGYIIKVYLDDQLVTKTKKSSIDCLINRCIGAKKIQKIIRKKNFKYFEVATKWIYPFPDQPEPPKSPEYTKHYGLLVATDMNLATDEANEHAWYYTITKEHLDELYYIISRAGGSSYRKDNIPYSNSGKFAFIDTEYPNQKPRFSSIKKYLRSEMQAYWDKIVKNGG